MANPLYPFVPKTTGVPAVLRLAGQVEAAIVPLLADAGNLFNALRPIWGIYDDQGSLLLKPDSFLSFEYQKEFQVSTYPVEEGGFQSYDKVARPYESRVSVTKSGSVDDRSGFLALIEDLVASTDLYQIVTPRAGLFRRQHHAHRVQPAQRSGRGDADRRDDIRGNPPDCDGGFHEQQGAGRGRYGQRWRGAGAARRCEPGAAAMTQQIPLAAIPNQTLSVRLGGQSCRINLRACSTGMFLDLYVNDAPIVQGVICRNLVKLVREPYLGFVGDLYFYDGQGVDDPTYDGLAGRFMLLWTGG